MRETFNTTPLPEIVVPTAEETVAMYERMGGRLTRDFGFGQDPLRLREDLKASREHIYRCRNPTDRVVYSHLVHRSHISFKNAVLFHIEITLQLSETFQNV